MTIRVLKPGLSTTIQDLGRYGYAHLGISPAGAADSLSFRIANLLVGNEENAPALEMTLLGATLEFDAAAIVAITGADCEAKLGSAQVPLNAAFEVPAGAVLSCGHMTDGARSYLAVQGGFEVPSIMGSASTYVRGHFGGHDGRRLRSGDVLNFCGATSLTNSITTSRSARIQFAIRAPLRVTRGAQQDWFGPEAFAALYSRRVHCQRYVGPRRPAAKGRSAAATRTLTIADRRYSVGAIQVPQDGQPIILFVDQQTTGGYPKIANVIAADMHRVGQLQPREEVRFAEVSIAEAIKALREQECWLKEIFQ